jgi:hypothetical protein
MSVPTNTARGIFTNAYLAAYKDGIPAKTFFQSFFMPAIKGSKYLSIEVQRNFEKVAVDVLRGSGENRNSWTKSTEKNFEPPYFNESFDNTSLEYYDRPFGKSPEINGDTIADVAGEVSDKILALRYKIERAIELQAAQVFETGVVAVTAGIDIDFKRKAASLKDNSAAPWSTITSPIEAQLIAGAEFIRRVGKSAISEFNTVMSGAEWVSLKASNYFTNNANFNQVKLIDINMPQTLTTGGAYHGTISAGAYIIHIWTNDETYDNASNVATRIWPLKKVLMLPVSGYKFDLGFAAVPAIIKDNATFMKGDFIVDEFVDYNHRTKNWRMQSAPLCIPKSIDQIYTMQVEV